MAGGIALASAGAVEAGCVGLVLGHNRFDGDATVLTGTETEVRGAVARLARALGVEVSAHIGVCKTCATPLGSWAGRTDWGTFCSTECEQADR